MLANIAFVLSTWTVFLVLFVVSIYTTIHFFISFLCNECPDKSFKDILIVVVMWLVTSVPLFAIAKL